MNGNLSDDEKEGEVFRWRDKMMQRPNHEEQGIFQGPFNSTWDWNINRGSLFGTREKKGGRRMKWKWWR